MPSNVVDKEAATAGQLECQSSTEERPSDVHAGQGNRSSNPQEWTKTYKWFLVGLLCLFTATVTFTCVGIVPVADEVVKELEGYDDRSAAVLLVTIWELGEATGPLFLAPLSEIYGRFWVYNLANCLFVIGTIITALSRNIHLLIFSRYLTGCAVASNVLNPAIIGDLFTSETRGAPMSATFLAPLLGGALGPIVSGALSQAVGWRPLMWLCVALAGAIEILFVLLFRETYSPIILKRLAIKRAKTMSDDAESAECNEADRSSEHTQCPEQDQVVRVKLLQSMTRPVQIIWSSSILQCLSLWGGVAFAFIYVYYASQPNILQQIYGFDLSDTGLSYLAWTLGTILSIFVCNYGMDRIYGKLGRRHGGFYPEGRLPIAIVGAFLLPLVVVLYGWFAQVHLPVATFLATVAVLCIAIVIVIVPMMTYITDTFGIYSASATTAVLVTRNLLATFLPLVVPPLSGKIGYGWGFTVLAAFTLILAPIPCLVMRYGPTWRQRSEYTKDKDKQPT